jgi:hypothetical protein
MHLANCMSSRLPGCRLLLAALLAISMVGPVAAQSSCRVDPGASWKGYTVKWVGQCNDGVAEGLGALRAYSKQTAVKSFFGRMAAGRPIFGVLETPQGYQAGPFENGEPVRNSERPLVIKAFGEAAAAARVASEDFKRQGNTASARYYQRVSEELAAQMD